MTEYGAMCLSWFCFCCVYFYKGWSGYSTIDGRSESPVDSMSDKSSTRVEFDGTCKNCPELSTDGTDGKTAAMVSQAEIWQEDKKFTVKMLLFPKNHYVNNKNLDTLIIIYVLSQFLCQ